jgi:putative tricarboxylic transport membrane protein
VASDPAGRLPEPIVGGQEAQVGDLPPTEDESSEMKLSRRLWASALWCWLLAGAAWSLGCAQRARDSEGDTARSADIATARAGGHIHFLIPGAPCGGWDGTARGVGEALSRSGLARSASYENLSGGGGGRALAHFIATAEQQHDTLFISSTPIVIASLRGRLPYSWRDVVPVASVIGDYLTFAVEADSPIASWDDVVMRYQDDPAALPIAGGSVLGGMDHLVTALALRAAGVDPLQLRYVPYDTGGRARAALFSGETPVLTTGLGEILDARGGGLVRLLGVTAPSRPPEAADVPTLGELGAGVEFVNWRGFFAPPGTTDEEVEAWVELLRAMLTTPEWEEVRRRNGWVEIFHPGREFTTFLARQEQDLAELLDGLGMRRRAE